jgi:hypothetical protein
VIEPQTVDAELENQVRRDSVYAFITLIVHRRF